MLATLGGFLALLLGLLLLLLPLLASELSRARDSVWGAVVLLLGLVLVTSADRLTGAPMLAVLCGGLLIGRLGMEVGQGRWRLLTEEERQRLWSVERWQTSLSQIGASLGRLLQLASGVVGGLGSWLAERRAARPASTKKWVRPEPEAAPAAEVEAPEEPGDDPPVVSGFEEIDALLEQALPEAPLVLETPEPGEGRGEAG
ncbi:Ycf66 family protein [Synechococcus sp. CCY 9618]|uniref:Ycf66 family protein n=1 Tax=Synechococcus sp. CCY 9618 TaxID=2815602 RepID=UPI001C230841|nr:Ycf66 family protein [Synechococcus sp. CCY 9618]